MGAEIPLRIFDQVERGIEQALRSFIQSEAGGSRVSVAAEPKVGDTSALAIAEGSEATASEIEQTGQAAVEIAAEIMKGAQQLAAGLRANGKKISEHLQEFAILAKKVSTAMRDTRASVLSSPGGSHKSDDLLPQQSCDKADSPERELFSGSHAGSARPLFWAHTEPIELRRILRVPPQPVERYQTRPWRFNEKPRSIPAGKKLRIELLAAARVHWTADEWATTHDDDTGEIGF